MSLIWPGTVSDDHHPVGKRDRFHQVVGDEDDGLALLFPNFQQLILKHHACLSIERPKGSSMRITAGS